ncbi:MAG: hypothetical protein H7196_05265 [candidate division SR1 bacterium]|nr:hypothetical protein [candidate division SR1 bacterium]
MNKLKVDPNLVLEVMSSIKDTTPESKQSITIKRTLLIILILFCIVCSTFLFSIFIFDIIDKIYTIDFLEKSPTEIAFKSVFELLITAILFIVATFILYRKTTLFLVKDRLKLVIVLTSTVLAIAGVSIVSVQLNIFNLKNNVRESKDYIIDYLLINHNLEGNKILIQGKVVSMDSRNIVIQTNGTNQEFLFDENNTKFFSKGTNIILKYKLNQNNQKIIEKIQVAK